MSCDYKTIMLALTYVGVDKTSNEREFIDFYDNMSEEEFEIYKTPEFTNEVNKRRKWSEQNELNKLERKDLIRRGWNIPYRKFNLHATIEQFKECCFEEDVKYMEDNYKTEFEWRLNLAKNIINYKSEHQLGEIVYYINRYDLSDDVLSIMNKWIDNNKATYYKAITEKCTIASIEICKSDNSLSVKLEQNGEDIGVLKYETEDYNLLLDEISNLVIRELASDEYKLETHMSQVDIQLVNGKATLGKYNVMRAIKKFYTKNDCVDVKYKIKI